MPQERLSMRKIHEVLRLKWESGLSNRAIARSCSISPTTVSEHVRRAQAAGLSWPLPEALDEDQLYRLLFPKPAPPSEREIVNGQSEPSGVPHAGIARKIYDQISITNQYNINIQGKLTLAEVVNGKNPLYFSA